MWFTNLALRPIRMVIVSSSSKKKAFTFPTNFQNIGYIEFESNDIQARTAELLKELIGFGLVRITPA